MPIKPQDKARILAEIGVDPKKYWMDDEGEIIDMPEQGTAETAIKTTLHNAPRTALGFVGSALGAAGAGALATPETAGLATIPAALAGGAAGGMAGGSAGQKLQDWLYPESWKLSEEARMVRAPITTKVANIGASMALLRPSATVFKAAARAPGEFMRTAGQLQPKTVEALANVGLGAGMSGGMAAAQGASPGEVALETALGALQVQPTWLGTKMSGGLFRPFTTEGLAEPGGLPTAEAQARFAAALEAQNAPPQPAIAPDALAELVTKFAKQQAADVKRIQEGVIAGEGARQNEVQRLRRAAVEAAMPPVQRAEGPGSLYPFVGEPSINPTIQRGKRAAAPEVEPGVLPGDTRTIDERLAATGGAPEQQMKLTPAVQQAQEAKLRGASPVEQELAMLLSPEQHKYFRDIFKKFDTEYGDLPENAASGRFTPRKSATEPSRTDISSRAYLDVYPHEALHALLSDTLNYGTARERAFTERALRELGIEVLTDANGRKSLAEGSEEALAKQVGEESIRVLAGKQKPAPVREAFSDFVDYLINDKLTPDVARRILRDRTVFGAGTRGIVARAARRGGMQAAAGAPPVMSEAVEQQPAAQAAVEKPFEPVELPERLAPTRDLTPEQIAQVEAAREAARTPPPAAQAEAVQAQRRADELAARAEQMKTLLDEQEARLRRLENAERTRQRIGALPESSLKAPRAEARRISNLNEFEQRRPSLREEEGSGAMTQEELDQAAAQRYADTGGEPSTAQEPIGEEFLPSDVRGYESSAAMRSMREAAARGERIGPDTDVTRPETVEYTGAPVPANVRAGVRRREAMLETPADLEARRIEQQLSGRDRGRDRYQPLAEDRPVFATQFQKELDSPNPLGAMPGKDGRIPANNLRTGLARLNNLERELLTNAGLDKFLRDTPRPTVAELKLWADEKLPEIKIRPQMAVVEASESAQARANLLHELESYEISPQFPDRVSDGMWFYRGELMPRWDLPEFAQEQVDALVMHDLEGAGNLAYDSATSRYTMVNPRELAGMPGAVDILVKMPGSGQKVAIKHYPKEGKDLVTHVRAYEHTLPDGTKALRVFELQSDWGQERRKLEASWPVVESLDRLPEGWSIVNAPFFVDLQDAKGKLRASSSTLDTLLTKYNVNRTREFKIIPDSPILSQTDSLGLKAAVEYARERGISKLIVDDAQTAMLTEVHDQFTMATAKPGDYTVRLSNRISTLLDKITIPKSGLIADAIAHKNDGSKFEAKDRLPDDVLALLYDAIPHRLAPIQERGMTRAYNDILPQLMRKMTGDKGVPVNMGKHKNAIVDGSPRENLVFKNPDGSPKTESTGIMYDLGVPQARRAAGEPFTVSGERYQPLAEDRIHADMAAVGQAQRGYPESFGVNSQTEFPPYVYQSIGEMTYPLEHIGDLIHRLSSNDGDQFFMAYSGGGSYYGRGAAATKLKKALANEKYVRSVGGLEQALTNSIKNAFDYYKRTDFKYEKEARNKSLPEMVNDGKNYIKRWAEEHNKLTPVTELQKKAQNITDAFGRLDTDAYFSRMRDLLADLEAPDWEARYYKRYENNERYQPMREERIQSPEFKKWFGDSKVTNLDGTPMVVYHGSSDTEFTVFDPNLSRYRKAMFFTPNYDIAKKFANKWGGSREPRAFYLKLENPLYDRYPAREGRDATGSEQAREALANGHDGFILNPIGENVGGELVYAKQYAVFDPRQIKSADNNIGTFDSSNPDIRYQPLGPERGEYKGAKLPERERRVFGRGIFAGNVEALRRTGDPQKVEFAGAMEELYARIRNYTGQYEEGIIRPLTDLSKASQQKVVEALYDESMAGKPATAGLSPDELAAHREIRAGLVKMRNDQIAANHLIEGKPAGRDPFYFPHVVDSSIIHDLSNSPESPRAKEAERQFIDFNAELFRNKGVAPAVALQRATEAFGKFIGSLKPISVDSGFDYGAVSMPAGTKLPPTWVAADPVDGFRSYIKRFSRARAFYDVIGRDENAMRQIGRKFYYDAAGKEAAVANPGSRLQRDPNVRALLENALGITHESQEGITPAIGRLANSLLLGNVATRLTDAATTPFKALAYLPPRYIPGLLTNMRNLRSSIDNAYKTGGVRRGDMMVVREILGAGDRYVKGMDKVAETITKYTGSEALEKGARFLAQNVGEYIYDVNKMLADSGDKRATDFMNRVTPKWRTLAREETAQRIARLFQGNYDATNLPIWIANSPAAPFFSMMKWNIEQWNNFKRFAWEPALKGDPYALMATVLGGVAGGIAVGELREKITGKKQRVATAGELNFGFREGDKARASMEAMRKAAFLSQVTGTFGIVGELSLQAIDVASKDKPQGFSWPAYEFVSNVIGKIANAVPAAIERPEDALLITGTAANDLAKDIVAQYRILWNAVDRTKGAGEVAEANRRRDLRMSEKLRGEPTRFSPFIERDYRNERERRFDKTRDRQQAVAIAKQLDQRARRESATGEEYKEARRKFRSSRIVGIPSAENNPQQFYRHIQFVRNTQGAEAADQLARDYVTLRTEQKWKSGMFR